MDKFLFVGLNLGKNSTLFHLLSGFHLPGGQKKTSRPDQHLGAAHKRHVVGFHDGAADRTDEVEAAGHSIPRMGSITVANILSYHISFTRSDITDIMLYAAVTGQGP